MSAAALFTYGTLQLAEVQRAIFKRLLEGRPDIEPVSVAGVVEVFNRNNARVRDLLLRLIPRIPRERACICANALTGAIIG